MIMWLNFFESLVIQCKYLASILCIPEVTSYFGLLLNCSQTMLSFTAPSSLAKLKLYSTCPDMAIQPYMALYSSIHGNGFADVIRPYIYQKDAGTLANSAKA